MWCLVCGTQLCSLTDYHKPHFLNKSMSQIKLFTTAGCSAHPAFVHRGCQEQQKMKKLSVFKRAINQFKYLTIINHMIVQVQLFVYLFYLL